MSKELDTDLTVITATDRAQCAAEWLKLSGVASGQHLSTPLLRKALAFERQCKALGSHSAATRRELRERTKGNANVPSNIEFRGQSPASRTLLPGNQLVREWNGRIYRVLVLDDGFELDGGRYGSLSAVARLITCAGWSGPRFFGLKKAP